MSGGERDAGAELQAARLDELYRVENELSTGVPEAMHGSAQAPAPRATRVGLLGEDTRP